MARCIDKLSKEEIIKIMEDYGNRSSFSKNQHSVYKVSEEKYPGLVDEILPKTKKTWRELGEEINKKQLILFIKKHPTRTSLIKNNLLYHKLCINKYPGLIEELFPKNWEMFKGKTDRQIKRMIIKDMKGCPTRSRFKWDYSFQYSYAEDHFPGLIDKYLPKLESAVNSMGELTTKLFLETLFESEFINCRPDWLVNEKTGRKLELDGYCEKLSLAFEYGNHVNCRAKNYPEKMKKIRQRDAIKKRRCKSLGIKLIQIKKDVFEFSNPEEEFRKILKKEFFRLNIDIPVNFKDVKFLPIFPHGYKYDLKTIWKIAKKFRSISQFQRKKSGAYKAARRSGILHLIRDYFKKSS